MMLSEVLDHYIGTEAGRPPLDVGEVHRFVRWCGSSRSVDTLTPLEVSDYGESVASTGGDVQGRLLPVKEFLVFLKRQGYTKISLSPHIRIPRGKGRSDHQGQQQDSEPISLTSDGYQAMVKEVDILKAQREGVAEDIRRAAADKDFRENAPLEAARERQGFIMSRILELEERLRSSVVVGEGRGRGQRIRVGARVVLRQMSSGQDVTYLLVDPAEADFGGGKISVASPVGKALLGRGVGDEVEVVAPRGVVRYHVLEVRG